VCPAVAEHGGIAFALANANAEQRDAAFRDSLVPWSHALQRAAVDALCRIVALYLFECVCVGWQRGRREFHDNAASVFEHSVFPGR
jgi:hypothetical protein